MKPMRKFAMLAAIAGFIAIGFGETANASITFPFDSDLIFYYSFDNDATATTATDDSANMNDGVISGLAHDCTDTPATSGNSCSLTTGGGFVDAGNDNMLQVSDGDFAIAMWIKFSSLNGDKTLVNKIDVFNTDGWFLLKQDDTKFWFCFGGGPSVNGCTPTAPTTVKSTTSASLETWTHVVGVKEGTDIKIYVNGVFEGTSDMTGGFTDTNLQNLLIGHPNTGGLIDEVRLYKVALSAHQVAVLANAPIISITTMQVSGPLRDIDGSFEDIDLDGDGQIDNGPVIGVGRDFAQHYALKIHIRNDGDDGALDGLSFLNVIADIFNTDPDGEDEADDSVDGICDDTDCDGVVADPSSNCPVTISGPTLKKNKIDPRYIEIEADTLDADVSCDTTVYVVTKQLSGGKGKNAMTSYEPDQCDVALTDGGADLIDAIGLNRGVNVYVRDTNAIVSGPHGPILATPIGCPQ